MLIFFTIQRFRVVDRIIVNWHIGPVLERRSVWWTWIVFLPVKPIQNFWVDFCRDSWHEPTNQPTNQQPAKSIARAFTIGNKIISGIVETRKQTNLGRLNAKILISFWCARKDTNLSYFSEWKRQFHSRRYVMCRFTDTCFPSVS